MDSIITQVNREDEQLNAFANDKGKDAGGTAQFLIIVQIFVLMKKRCCFWCCIYPGLLNSLDEEEKKIKFLCMILHFASKNKPTHFSAFSESR